MSRPLPACTRAPRAAAAEALASFLGPLPARHGPSGTGTARRLRRAIAHAVGTRGLKEQIEQWPMARQQQHRLVVAQDGLQLLELLQEGVELRVLTVGLVAYARGGGVGLALMRLLLVAGLGQQVALFLFRLAGDVLLLLFAFALVVGHLFLPFAADALEDLVANLDRMVEAAQADVHQVDAELLIEVLLQARQQPALQAVEGFIDP